ncbi:MAG: hypothetical protein E7412_08185 [Ruminococcaceae bacterium]|nr:hypothetical protein [Oscillospiraceae bacterium]
MDVIQNYQCPCCTAPLVFDAETQNLICESCDNTFPLDTIQQMADSVDASSGTSKFDWENYTPRNYEDTNEVTLSNYSCPSCGAEIQGDDTLGSTVCPYCGNSTIVKGQFEGTLKPDYIIPFKLNKKAAMEAFEGDFKNAPFLPDSFKNKKKIEEMAGVYVPFWMFDCDCDAAVSYNAERVTAWSDANYNYTKTDYYKLFRSGKVGFANIPVDGSKKADDAYMEAVEPYNYEDAVEFSGAYLSGYLADKYDVSAEESIERANERVKNSTIAAFNDTTGHYTAVIPESARVGFSNGKIRYSLLPVWMLNIKYMDNMYQFAINGQTGKVVGKYPIDEGKKWKYFAKVAGFAYVAAAIIGWLLLH